MFIVHYMKVDRDYYNSGARFDLFTHDCQFYGTLKQVKLFFHDIKGGGSKVRQVGNNFEITINK